MSERFPCPKCAKSISSEGNLRVHLKSVHSEERIPCPKCDVTFSRKSSLDEHIEAVHQNIYIKCNFCDRKSKWKHDIRKHIRIRHTEAGLHENVEKNVKIALFMLRRLKTLEGGRYSLSDVVQIVEKELFSKRNVFPKIEKC